MCTHSAFDSDVRILICLYANYITLSNNINITRTIRFATQGILLLETVVVETEAAAKVRLTFSSVC